MTRYIGYKSWLIVILPLSLSSQLSIASNRVSRHSQNQHGPSQRSHPCLDALACPCAGGNCAAFVASRQCSPYGGARIQATATSAKQPETILESYS